MGSYIDFNVIFRTTFKCVSPNRLYGSKLHTHDLCNYNPRPDKQRLSHHHSNRHALSTLPKKEYRCNNRRYNRRRRLPRRPPSTGLLPLQTPPIQAPLPRRPLRQQPQHLHRPTPHQRALRTHWQRFLRHPRRLHAVSLPPLWRDNYFHHRWYSPSSASWDSSFPRYIRIRRGSGPTSSVHECAAYAVFPS